MEVGTCRRAENLKKKKKETETLTVMNYIVFIVVKNGKIKIKNEKNVVLLKKIKNGKNREKNGKENNLTLLHLLLHFKIKNLVYTI